MRLHVEKRLALIQAGHALLVVDGAGKRRVGIEQDFRAVLQLQALAFADHGQVVGLQAHGQVAKGEQADQQHGCGGQGFPVPAQAPAHGAALALVQLHRYFAQGGAIPQRFGFDIGLGVFWRSAEPRFKSERVVFVGALQAYKPIQCLVHGTGAGVGPGR
ncbi:hypothetical protein D3C76_706120 [compost metagenome]